MRRTMLFIPGNSPGMLINADVHRADAIVLDLEDAVAPTEKDAARFLMCGALEKFMPYRSEVIIRINALSTPFWKKDLEAVVPFRPGMIMPSKVDTAQDIRVLDGYIGEIEGKCGIPAGSVRLIPLLETAASIEHAYELALASERMEALYLGAEDLTADLCSRRTKEGLEIQYARQRLLVAARTAKIKAYDTPFTDVDDLEGLRRDAEMAKRLGFDGKAVISPHHVDCVNEIFTPSAAEIEYARAVMAAIERGVREGKGAVSLNGKMIDPPIVARARQTLDTAELIYGSV